MPIETSDKCGPALLSLRLLIVSTLALHFLSLSSTWHSTILESDPGLVKVENKVTPKLLNLPSSLHLDASAALVPHEETRALGAFYLLCHPYISQIPIGVVHE